MDMLKICSAEDVRFKIKSQSQNFVCYKDETSEHTVIILVLLRLIHFLLKALFGGPPAKLKPHNVQRIHHEFVETE